MNRILPVTWVALEMGKVLDIIGRRCRSELGTAFLSNVTPAEDLAQLSSRQSLLRELVRFRELEGDLPWDNEVFSVSSSIESAKTSALLTGLELKGIASLLLLASKVKEEVTRVKERFPEFGQLGRKIRDFSEEIKALEVLDDDGRLYDHASSSLKD